MSSAPHPGKSRLWPHLRAAFVTVHVAAVVLAALPAPVGSLQRSAWSEPTVARELDAWHARARAVGLGYDRDAFEDRLYELARGWVHGRQAVLEPFRPYYRYLGVEQSWRMFVAPHKHPSRLQIHIRPSPDSAWELLYSQGDPDYAWRSAQLEHTRMRSALFRYSWPGYRRSYRALTRWVGREVAAERPDAGQVRLQWLRQKTPTPAQVRTDTRPPPTVVRPYVTDLSGLRP